ncbi:MAG: S8 family peptidase [Caldimonas sp.]
MSILRLSFLALVLCGALSFAHAGSNVQAGTPASVNAAAAGADSQTVNRFIVKLRDNHVDAGASVAAVGAAFGERLDLVRAMSGGAHVVRLGRRVMRGDAPAVARLLRSDPRVLWVEPDTVLHPLGVPNDTMYAQQWHYYESLGGINLPGAWDITTGSASITIAVIDTGVLPHAELAGRLVAGYDFISDATTANDGDGRDGNAADAGDYGCNGANSSWHGTHVAGTIGAASNNGAGVTGINWVSKIQPIRVLGRCGGYTSDIVDGMRWAAGIAVPGVSANATPARVENLSFGGGGMCSQTFQGAIDDVVARGTVVVVAAGNSNADVAGSQPANCNGVIAVAATMRNGGRAGYSNYGATVAIAAPGGGGSDGILSTLNTGTTVPAADSYAYFQGTSMATPHVAGVASLMLSVNPALTPADVLARLRASARVFPTGTGSDCNTSICGAGIVNAAAALSSLVAAPPPVPGWTRIAVEGQAFTVSGTQTVRYGSSTSWITMSVSGSGNCTNAFFGNDPLYGVAKECQLSATTPTPTPPVPPPAPGWTKIADEGAGFTVSGTQTVRYGSGSSFISASVSSRGTCTNGFFGSDPIYGVVKECDVAGAAAPTWTAIANENETFGFSGTRTVRYGSGASWITLTVTGGGACSNAFFGSDPIYGVVKHCEVSS